MSLLNGDDCKSDVSGLESHTHCKLFRKELSTKICNNLS
ncbi:hypothetical protein UES1_113 [Escherichia phage UE-S1]|nr:hypothetical protein UES1_113 [Escherichia phage UE-S1]